MELKRYKIALVDDNLTNLAAGKELLKGYFEVFPLPSAAKLFALLKNVTPDLILLDIEMPEMNGYEAIKLLKKEKDLADIPVIFLTAKDDEYSELEGFNLGAVDYMSKPFSEALLLKRVETHILLARQKKELLSQQMQLKKFNQNLQQLVHEKTQEILVLQNAVLETVTDLVEFRDHNTGGHAARTQRYLEVMGNRMSERTTYHSIMAGWNKETVYLSGQLHDVGKIGIPDAILHKPARLTDGEFEIIKKHPAIGVDAISKIENNTRKHEFLHHAKIFAGAHHEKWDGTGYPMALGETDIPLEGRMMAIVDVYDALISNRPYKEAFSTDYAAKVIVEGSGTHFDPGLIEIFRDIAEEFAKIATEEKASDPDK